MQSIPGTPKQETSASSQDQNTKTDSPVVVKGILSRLSRPKMSTQHSPKQEKKPTWSRHSYSTPNLKALSSSATETQVTGIPNIPEGESSPHSKDDTDMNYSHGVK
jgi:hypothetical protein